MYPVVSELDSAIDLLIEDGMDPSSLVVVEESPDFPGELVFQAVDSEFFYSEYREWISRFLILSQVFVLQDFIELLEKDDRTVLFGPSCQPILSSYEKWEAPLDIKNFSLELYPYQSWSLQRALEQDFYFVGWAPGTGKSIFATAGSQELFNRDRIDLVLCFTLTAMKHNMERFYQDTTALDVVVNDGTPAKRKQRYANGSQVFIANYERAWADFNSLKELVSTHRTLFVLDEAHKVLTDGKPNKMRTHLNALLQMSHRPIIWPMSATVISHSPFRYRDVFSLNRSQENPLGTKREFENRYVLRKRERRIRTRTGKTFPLVDYEWNTTRLQEVRHRVADLAHNIRKTDVGVRENFRGLQVVELPVQLSEEDRRLYEIIEDRAREAMEREESLAPYFRLLRYTCCCPQAVRDTNEEVGKEVSAQYPALATNAHSAKMEMLVDLVETIQDSGDKIVVFIRETNLGLFYLRDLLAQRRITHRVHYGVGQSARESQKAQDDFKRDPNITVFLSSDAGAFGLNLPEARYVVSVDVPYSYDILQQRFNRIDRADSWLDGMTAYVMITENSVEQRVWRINNQRRELAAATLGTNELLSYGDRLDQDTLSYLIFGEK